MKKRKKCKCQKLKEEETWVVPYVEKFHYVNGKKIPSGTNKFSKEFYRAYNELIKMG